MKTLKKSERNKVNSAILNSSDNLEIKVFVTLGRDEIANMEKVVWGVSTEIHRPEGRWLQSGVVYAVNRLFYCF